jgi:energy-coupling factor transporter ATP-binding protein EcfA2
MSKLLPNLPIEDLTTENDYIGIIEKGTLLKSFFLNNKHEFSQVKIFSIYGEWGSGKSTLMKYLEKELKGSFNTFFFESWEFESDKNLSLSLLETLTKETDSTSDELLKNGGKLLEGFAKSATFKTPFVNFSAKEMINGVDNLSFLKLKEKFKEDFIKWENKITTKDKSPDYNIVFIDDLDRCEPENILNLLSAMKLFFTYGKKTIFLCGIDKKAIREAVKTKYGEVVKANEYLEKIFDISFSMPESVNTSKLIHQYFNEDEKVVEEKLGDLISNFFEKLNFRNPRRIKKILNKYLIIKRLKETKSSDSIMLPNIIYKDSGTLFETYLTLYLLILNEFEPENFKSLFNLSAKTVNYTEALRRGCTDSSKSSHSIFSYFKDNSLNEKYSNHGMNERGAFLVYISNFSPLNVDSLKPTGLSDKSSFLLNFGLKNKQLEYYFLLFIFSNEVFFIEGLKNMKYTCLEYKKMISNLI